MAAESSEDRDLLAAIIGKPRKPRTCRVCREPQAAQIVTRLILTDQGIVSIDHSGPPSKSKTMTLCSKHAVQLWNEIMDAFDGLGDDLVDSPARHDGSE